MAWSSPMRRKCSKDRKHPIGAYFGSLISSVFFAVSSSDPGSYRRMMGFFSWFEHTSCGGKVFIGDWLKGDLQSDFEARK